MLYVRQTVHPTSALWWCAGWFASDISEVSGHATCYSEKDRIGDFVCGGTSAANVKRDQSLNAQPMNKQQHTIELKYRVQPQHVFIPGRAPTAELVVARCHAQCLALPLRGSDTHVFMCHALLRDGMLHRDSTFLTQHGA
jgi:hypothetical protein